MSTKSETFIVQNPTPSWCEISPMHKDGIRLQFAPFEVKDLSFMDPAEISGNQNLKNCLRSGLLRKITPEEQERHAELKTAQLRREVTKLQQPATNTERQQVGDKFIDVEPINVSRTDSSKMSEQVTSAGAANDPMSYAIALEIAQNNAKRYGKEVSVEDFWESVQNDPELIRRLITGHTQAVPDSAIFDEDFDATPPTTATFTTPPTKTAKSTGVGKKKMSATIVQQEEKIPGSSAEAIDLVDELNKD